MVWKKVWPGLMVGLLMSALFPGGIQPVLGAAFGSEFQVNTTIVDNQDDGAIIMDSSGNFIICWEDYSSGNNDIKFQRYNYPYTAQGGEGTVASGVSNQEDVSAAMDSSGNFVVVWEDDTATNDDVKARRYSSSGTAQGGVITVASGAGNQDDVAVAMDSSGNFVVVWEDSAAGNDDVKAQRYSSSGTAQGGVITVASGAGDQDDADVAMDSSGNFVVVWEDSSGAGGNDVCAQRYNSSGTAQGDVVTVASGAGGEDEPAVAMDSYGSFVVAWDDDTANSGDVKARRYNSTGVAQGSIFTVNTYTTNFQGDAAVALDDNGGSVVTWESADQDTSNRGVFAQRFSNISTTWYFAEGYTGTGFEEWLTLQNPNSVAATVTVTYMFRDGTSQTKTKSIPANSRETVSVNTDVGSNKEVSIKVESDQPVIAERPMYFNYQNKWKGGHNTIGATSTSTNWYFAEGYTGSNFDTWLTLQNPGGTNANVTITYYFRGGGTVVTKYATVAATSRETINVNSDVGSNQEVSIKVSSTEGIIAERPMYFKYQNKWDGGHNTIGTTATSTSWYFAEGYTGTGFEEWLTLQNPNAVATAATITYMFKGGGAVVTKNITIPAHSRETVNVNSDVGSNKEVSIKVESVIPIVAERPMYFNYQNKWYDGHNTIGAKTPVNQWFFAEGYTGTGFEEWLTLQNPNSVAANATITFYFRGGETPVTMTKTIPANSRETIEVNVDAGSNKEVSMKVSCDQPITAERPMYFDYQDKWEGGHNTIGYGP